MGSTAACRWQRKSSADLEIIKNYLIWTIRNYKVNKNKQNCRDLWDNNKTNIHVIKVLKERKKMFRTEITLEEIMAGKFPDLTEDKI